MTIETPAPSGMERNPTIVLVCRRQQLSYLSEWLEEWNSVESLRDLPLRLIVEKGESEAFESIFRELNRASITELPEDESRSKRGLARAYGEVFDSLETTYFAIHRVSRKKRDSAATLAKRLHASTLPLPTETDRSLPILIPTAQIDKIAVRAYVNYALSHGTHLSNHWKEYLGYVSSLTSVSRIEATDPIKQGSAIKVHIRVTNGRFNNAKRPPWTYDLAVLDSSRKVILRAPLQAKKWRDTDGEVRWEAYEGIISLDAVPNGDFELVLILNTTHLEMKPIMSSLQPRPGATTPARTIPDDTGTTADAIHKYLVHTTGGANSTWLSKESGPAKIVNKVWRKRLLRKDLRAILKRDGSRPILRSLIMYRLTKPFLRNREIWLIGERKDTAQDNGFHLFKYLQSSKSSRDVYYVIDPRSPHAPRVNKLGKVLKHSSFKHKILTLHADVLANAYSLTHMVPRQWGVRNYFLHMSWRTNALRVYLKHGINTGVNSLQRGANGYDIYITASRRETDAVLESSGYNDEVAETGLARYDALTRTPSEDKVILFMPTWRSYLVPNLFSEGKRASSHIAGSDYEKGVLAFLRDPRLEALLRSSGFRIRFLPHYNAKHHFLAMQLANDFIDVLDDKYVDFQQELRSCSIFVTDYSSVHFDIAYMGTPLVYYQFDAVEFTRKHASQSWFNFEQDGFGRVAYTLNEVYLELEKIIQNGSVRPPEYNARAHELFSFSDQQNSARITKAIETKLEGKQ